MASGFRQARIDVGAGGRTVTIAIPAGAACTAEPRDEARIVRQLRQAVPFLSRVSVRASGSDRALSSYVSARCPRSRLPAGPGRVVYRRTGRGFLTTRSFTVHSRRWSVEFENGGAFFALFVLRNRKVQPKTITARRRTAASKTFTGPGTFRLRISGSGHWTVRVRDGA